MATNQERLRGNNDASWQKQQWRRALQQRILSETLTPERLTTRSGHLDLSTFAVRSIKLLTGVEALRALRLPTTCIKLWSDSQHEAAARSIYTSNPTQLLQPTGEKNAYQVVKVGGSNESEGLLTHRRSDRDKRELGPHA